MRYFKILSAVLLVLVTNDMVNISSNLWLGLKHPELYFPITILGVIGSTIISFYGAYKILEYFIDKRGNNERQQ